MSCLTVSELNDLYHLIEKKDKEDNVTNDPQHPYITITRSAIGSAPNTLDFISIIGNKVHKLSVINYITLNEIKSIEFYYDRLNVKKLPKSIWCKIKFSENQITELALLRQDIIKKGEISYTLISRNESETMIKKMLDYIFPEEDIKEPSDD